MADLKGGAGKIIHHVVCFFFVFFKYRNSYCVTRHNYCTWWFSCLFSKDQQRIQF